jgi:predicted acetyltransferase
VEQIRPVDEGEFPELVRVMSAAFGSVPTAEEVADDRLVGELDRSLAVFEDGQITAVAGAYTFELTAPGPVQVPAAGVTWVGVLPTHRRRGLLTRLMARQLADVAERGEPVAILTASEATIYRRFGYGLASWAVNAEVTKHRSAFLRPPAAGGRMRLVAAEEAAKVVPAVYDAWRRRRVGAINRSDRYWELVHKDRERWRDGASARFYAVHESDAGVADGYVSYRVKEDWDANGNRSQVRTFGFFAVDHEVEAALWRFVLDLDLTSTLKAYYQPADDDVRLRLADQRAYRVAEVGDWLWACLVDVAGALAARRYGAEGSLVVEVVDGFRPEAGGRFRLDAGPDGAECARTSAEPDLVLEAPDLGAAWLGGTRFSALRRAGLVEERTPGAVARADALFATDPLPYCNTGF